MTIPSEMRALLLNEQHPHLADAIGGLRVETRPVRLPRSGQVLVRMEAAPCHPSDLMFLQGRYGVQKTLPTVPGSEGSGTVVAAGGGLLDRWLNGKRVACAVRTDTDGTWAQYCLVESTGCIPLPQGIDFDQGATSLANPLTAVALLDVALSARHRAVVNTAAAGQLGQMFRAVAAQARLPVINVVRRAEQVNELEQAGEAHILSSSDANFDQDLAAMTRELGATLALDAVAGPLTGRLMLAMPEGSTVLVYGSLSEAPCAGIEAIEFIFSHKTLAGFEVAQWLDAKTIVGRVRTARQAQALMLSGAFKTKIQKRISLSEGREGLLHYIDHMSDGKVLISPRAD